MGNEYLLDFLKITGWTAPTRLRDVKAKQNTALLGPTGTLVRQADGHFVESLHLRSDTSCFEHEEWLAQQFWEEKRKESEQEPVMNNTVPSAGLWGVDGTRLQFLWIHSC